MPVLYVLDKDTKEVVRIEESFSSLVWTERYQETGDFVLDIPIDKANFDAYKRGNYVVIDESQEIMVVESLNINEEMEDPLLEVTGRSLSLVLERRVNASKLLDNYAETINYQGSLSSVVQSVVNDEISDPYVQIYTWYYKDENGERHEGYSPVRGSWKGKKKVSAPYRKISGFNYLDLTTGIEVDKTFNKIMSVYEILNTFAKAHVFGFRVRFDENGNMQLQTYKGVDRTSNQKVLDPVIFNPVMDNISYVNYFEDQTDYRNIALSYSDGACSPIDFDKLSYNTDIFSGYVWVANDSAETNEEITGLDRFEMAVDARSSASVVNYDPSDYNSDDSNTDADLTAEEMVEEITKKVAAEATEEFDSDEYDIVKKSEGAIDPLVRYQFGVDYFLGDIVEISNNRGIVMTAVIDEVVRSYDADGFIVTPNFTSMEDYDYGEEDSE